MRRLPERRKGNDLKAEIVFEIKDRRPVTQAGSEFTAGCGDSQVRLMAQPILGLRKRLQPLPLLFERPFCRNRIRDVTGGTGFVGIV
jgi:hypothetical protein